MDNVNHPKHYNQGKIEVLEFLEDQKLDPHSFAAVKYICRAGHKDPNKKIEDVEKAIWYLERLREILVAEKEGRTPCRPNEMKKRDQVKTVQLPDPEPKQPLSRCVACREFHEGTSIRCKICSDKHLEAVKQNLGDMNPDLNLLGKDTGSISKEPFAKCIECHMFHNRNSLRCHNCHGKFEKHIEEMKKEPKTFCGRCGRHTSVGNLYCHEHRTTLKDIS